MQVSLFDIFRIGIGPSSSHTVGPMRAARSFVASLWQESQIAHVTRVQVELFGSLALTGHGHGSHRAIQLGFMGETPEHIDPLSVDNKLREVQASGSIQLLGQWGIPFQESRDLLFRSQLALPGHPNSMRFTALDRANRGLKSAVYYSIGGGFITCEGEEISTATRKDPPYPFSSARELLRLGEVFGLSIWKIVLENERTWHSETAIGEYIDRIWRVMRECTSRGLETEGILPGGLNVRRRAPWLRKKLEKEDNADPLAIIDWVNAFAMAVNEENAAGGRVVTAPTNGSAGVIPAVAHYLLRFVPGASETELFRFFLTASAIGGLYKENASISGAEVGCQGEVGVACSMAAGALVAALGGTNSQVEYAAEIGMEHNLGMTCDPIAGLVQIPCIERNAMGAVKALNACRIAIRESGEHKVSLDQVIATMYQTGLDMQAHYKETSLAGLAVNVANC